MDPGISPEEIEPISILMDELSSEDVQLRLNAIHSIPTIALALGPDRAREELIPFLQSQVDDEDEVLLALAEELGKHFEEYIGGNEHAHVLLGPLENLSAVEETLVRDKAAESITKIADVMSQNQVETYYIPLLKRLTSGEWFTSRTSAAALYPAIYSKASPAIQAELRKGYAALGSDDTPMVRRAAAKSLGPLLKHFSQQHILSDGIPVYRRLQADDQDSVRLLTIENLIVIAQKLSPAEVKELLLKQIRQSINDKSWRVRYMAASHFNELAEAVGSELVREELIGHYIQLLKDNEAEVRTAAATQVPGFSKLLDREVILARIVPCVRDLSQDTSQHVRAALASQIHGLAPLLTKEPTLDHLLAIFLNLLKDEFPDVRLNMISKLEIINDVIGIEMLSKDLLPAIVNLAEDKSWRVREAIIQYIPLLAKQFGRTWFDEHLSNVCISWLGDPTYSIREAAMVNLKKLVEVFGVDWARTTVVPKVLGFRAHHSFPYRMTIVQTITTIAPVLTLEIIRDDIIGVLLEHSKDPIPNIRFKVSQSLEAIASAFGSSPEGRQFVQKFIIPTLEQQKNDVDVDVRYFATKALQKALPLSES